MKLNAKIDALSKQYRNQDDYNSDLIELVDLNKTNSSQYFMANSESNGESSQFIENSEQYVSISEKQDNYDYKQETRNLVSADPKRHSIPKFFKIEYIYVVIVKAAL